MTARTTTWKGVAPAGAPQSAAQPQPKHDSESPKSGVRLVAPPPRVPRPGSRPPHDRPPTERPATDKRPSDAPTPPRLRVVPPEPEPPAPPPSKRAAVRERTPRLPGQILPPAPKIPASMTAPPSIGETPAPTPSPIHIRSVVTTAQDWPLVRPPAPVSPSFGVKYRDSFHSLPAFLPPPELLNDLAPAMTVDVPISASFRADRISEGELEIARSRRAMELRSRRAMILAGFLLVVVLACVVLAFAHN